MQPSSAPSTQPSSAPSSANALLLKASEWVASHGQDKYAGWIEYRRFRAAAALAKAGANSEQFATESAALQAAFDLVERDGLSKMRGVCEWAYLSRADRSGQPFTLYIPDSYDPAKSYPLMVSMHGGGGTHAKNQPFGAGHPEQSFQLRLMGRARGGGYADLCEVDVLESTAYVCSQWHIDADRINLDGSSMGGRGTFLMGSRHPELFASGFLRCGYGADLPVTNMLNLPLFSLHSDDDMDVSITQSRLPLGLLRRAGGQVIQWEVTGYGHPVGDCKEAMDAGQAWAKDQRRATAVRRINYTATDELARGAYWAEVAKWGKEPSPAHFDIQVGQDNMLYAELDNVGALAVDLLKAPVDRAKPMSIAVNAMIRSHLPANLPDKIYICADGAGWTVSANPPADPGFRWHFPGGADALYHGEPLMIVFGSRGSNSHTGARRVLAELGCASTGPSWHVDNETPLLRNMLYGRIPVKADVDVTDQDIRDNNLILLGTAQQNAVVARMADKLPVKIADARIVTSDGATYPFADNAMGLLYYNPIEPRRLIYWLAMDGPCDGAAGLGVMQVQKRGCNGCDMIIAPASTATVVAQRNFLPDWTWQSGYDTSGPVPESLLTSSGWQWFQASVLTEETGSDAAFVDAAEHVPFQPGVRWMDVQASPADQKMVILRLSGRELIACLAKLADAAESPGDDQRHAYCLVGLQARPDRP